MSTEMLETIREYFKTQPVLKAWLFGSFARGEETEDSDLDILVVFDKNARVSLIGHATMMLDLEVLLNRAMSLFMTITKLMGMRSRWLMRTDGNTMVVRTVVKKM